MTKRNYDDEHYKKARRAVLKRDGRKCKMPGCGSRNRLQVHHILRWVDAPYLRYDVKNMVTLCKKCHDTIKDREHIFAKLLSDAIK